MAARKNSTKVTKVCTKSGRSYTGTPDQLAESFYRDKSQKDGLAPWDKQAEREYNKAYRAGLAAAKVARKKDVSAPKALKAFEAAMVNERVPRGKAAKAEAAAPAKAPRKKATAKK